MENLSGLGYGKSDPITKQLKRLSSGEKVISEGQMLLMPGARVRVLENKAPTQAEAEPATASTAIGT